MHGYTYIWHQLLIVTGLRLRINAELKPYKFAEEIGSSRGNFAKGIFVVTGIVIIINSHHGDSIGKYGDRNLLQREKTRIYPFRKN